MNAVIESYKVEEITGELGTMAADSMAVSLIESLGLTGQKTLVNTTTETRVAFRRMTQVESDVFGLLFPQQSRVEEFNAEIIPLRVLELLKEAKESGQFVKFEVWHARTRKEDPILVGVTGTAQPQSWDAHYVNATGRFLIARWGDALLPFAKLCEQAKKVWVTNTTLDCKTKIGELQQKLATVELEAEQKFATVEG